MQFFHVERVWWPTGESALTNLEDMSSVLDTDTIFLLPFPCVWPKCKKVPEHWGVRWQLGWCLWPFPLQRWLLKPARVSWWAVWALLDLLTLLLCSAFFRSAAQSPIVRTVFNFSDIFQAVRGAVLSGNSNHLVEKELWLGSLLVAVPDVRITSGLWHSGTVLADFMGVICS